MRSLEEQRAEAEEREAQERWVEMTRLRAAEDERLRRLVEASKKKAAEDGEGSDDTEMEGPAHSAVTPPPGSPRSVADSAVVEATLKAQKMTQADMVKWLAVKMPDAWGSERWALFRRLLVEGTRSKVKNTLFSWFANMAGGWDTWAKNPGVILRENGEVRVQVEEDSGLMEVSCSALTVYACKILGSARRVRGDTLVGDVVSIVESEGWRALLAKPWMRQAAVPLNATRVEDWEGSTLQELEKKGDDELDEMSIA